MKRNKNNNDGLLKSKLGKRVMYGAITVVCFVGITLAVNKGCVSEETGELLKETTREVIEDMKENDSLFVE